MTCPCCKESLIPNKPQIKLSDRRKGLIGTWSNTKCDSCGVYFLDPIPTDDELASYYASYSTDNKLRPFKGLGFKFPFLRKIYHKFTGDVDPRDFIYPTKNARILDYGCGHATYLKYFHERGFNISGAEITDFLVEACQQHELDVHKVNDFNHIPFPDNEFDIVYLMQVFEHLKDPHAFMNELSRIMKKDGILYIAVPNSSSMWKKVFKKNWISGWFAPFHLFHYNDNNLTKLAEQYNLTVVNSWSNTPIDWFILNLKAWLYPNENKLDSEKKWLDYKIIKYLIMTILRIIEISSYQRDCLVVHLKKI
jgi:SAM-dependent methyltransferase